MKSGAEQQKTIGRTIRAEREAVGMSLRALAFEVGISHTHLVRIELGERNLTAELSKSLTHAMAKHLKNKKGKVA